MIFLPYDGMKHILSVQYLIDYMTNSMHCYKTNVVSDDFAQLWHVNTLTCLRHAIVLSEFSVLSTPFELGHFILQ